MTRALLGLVLGALTVLAIPGPAQAAGRCPYSAQAQLQIQMQWQQQMWMQQQYAARLNQSRGGSRMGYIGHVRHQQMRSTHTATRRTTHTTVHRRTVTHLRPILTRRISTHTRSTVHRSLHGGRGGALLPLAHTRTTHLRMHLRRITQHSRHVTRHTTLTHRRTTTTRHRLEMSIHRRISSTRPRTARHTERKARQHMRHRPTVKLRVQLTGTCGTCHQCTQNRPPTMTSLPERPLFPIGPRPGPRPGLPWLPRGPGPMVRLPGLPQRPQIGPRLVPPLFFGKPQPRPIPSLQPPVLPPLGTVRVGEPRRPMLEPVTDTRGDKPGPSIGDEPARLLPALESSPPPLPRLEGAVAQLSPLLDQHEDAVPRSTGAHQSDLRPDRVVEAPRLAPLPGLRPHQQGLLPNLDTDDPTDAENSDTSRRTALVELTLRPPPLPPLPVMASP